MAEGKDKIITHVARQIFSKYGFLKTTVDDIARAACETSVGVSPRTNSILRILSQQLLTTVCISGVILGLAAVFFVRARIESKVVRKACQGLFSLRLFKR